MQKLTAHKSISLGENGFTQNGIDRKLIYSDSERIIFAQGYKSSPMDYDVRLKMTHKTFHHIYQKGEKETLPMS